MRNLITVYSRHGCHLCEEARVSLLRFQAELNFNLETLYIDGDKELEERYGEEVPVIHIDGVHHDFFRVDPERFKSSLAQHRLHQ